MNRTLFVLLSGLMALVIGVSGFAAGVLTASQLSVPSYSYSTHVYPATPSVVCAGDVIHWTPELRIHASDENPVVPSVVQTIYRTSNPPATKLFDDSPVYAVYMSDAVLSPTIPLTVPLTLAPGTYEVRVGRVETGYRAVAYRVPFVVRACDQRKLEHGQ